MYLRECWKVGSDVRCQLLVLFGFMFDKGTTDVIFIMRQAKKKRTYYVFYTEFLEKY